MENPNARVNIRRHNSLPACGRATSRKISSSSPELFFHRNRNHLPGARSNPYVGWFRHSPPITSLRKIYQATTCTTGAAKTQQQHQFVSSHVAQTHYKTSPYVGWFRHDPPSTSSSSTSCSASSSPSWLATRSLVSDYVAQELSLWLSCAIPIPDANGLLRLTDLLSGHLAGGKPSSSSFGTHSSSSSSAVATTAPYSLTALLLRRVAGWIQGQGEQESRCKKGSSSDYLVHHPHLYHPKLGGGGGGKSCSSSRGVYQDEEFCSSSASECSSYDDDDDDDSTGTSSSSDDGSCDSVDPMALQQQAKRRLGHSRRRSSSGGASSCSQSSMMVSSQAEAYYAHATVTQKTATVRTLSCSHLPGILQDCDVYERPNNNNNNHSSSSSSSHEHNNTSNSSSSSTGLGRLDYEISQMDIVRMTRNASRHLDVESIVKLPTVTYTTSTTTNASTTPSAVTEETVATTIPPSSMTTTPQQQQQEITDESWMLVPHEEEQDSATTAGSNVTDTHHHQVQQPPTPSSLAAAAAAASPQQQEEQSEDVCVICLEHFVEGDRLRVLPCDHSFHVGCIDQWLSGSSSFVECYTTGCPTCKKHPYQHHHHQDAHAGNDNDDLLVWHATTAAADPSSSSALDGSHPSWAFARIGNVLARESSFHG